MPTYEYKCEKCGYTFDVIQKISEEPLKTCSECGGPLKKVMHPVGISFRGSGFYSTDYAGRRSKDAVSANGESGSSDGGTGSGKDNKEKKDSKAPEKKSPEKVAGD